MQLKMRRSWQMPNSPWLGLPREQQIPRVKSPVLRGEVHQGHRRPHQRLKSPSCDPAAWSGCCHGTLRSRRSRSRGRCLQRRGKRDLPDPESAPPNWERRELWGSRCKCPDSPAWMSRTCKTTPVNLYGPITPPEQLPLIWIWLWYVWTSGPLLLKVFQIWKKINVINIPILETVTLLIFHWFLTN